MKNFAKFLASKKYKVFMGYVYGFGAAIVLVGALFKLTHWLPGQAANIMLAIGLFTEALIFILSSFEPPHMEPDWSLVYPELAEEGLAREIVNRIQNMRKDGGFEVTDHIMLTIEKNSNIDAVVEKYQDYICSETLATLNLVDNIGEEVEALELIDDITAKIKINKI